MTTILIECIPVLLGCIVTYCLSRISSNASGKRKFRSVGIRKFFLFIYIYFPRLIFIFFIFAYISIIAAIDKIVESITFLSEELYVVIKYLNFFSGITLMICWLIGGAVYKAENDGFFSLQTAEETPKKKPRQHSHKYRRKIKIKR